MPCPILPRTTDSREGMLKHSTKLLLLAALAGIGIAREATAVGAHQALVVLAKHAPVHSAASMNGAVSTPHSSGGR